MSNTYKTKPFWVKIKQGHLASREVHYHVGRECDMPPPDYGVAFAFRDQHCHREFVYTGVRTCCCYMCHGDPYGPPPNRVRRREGRRSAQRWDREYESPDEEYAYETTRADENVEAAMVAYEFCPACYK